MRYFFTHSFAFFRQNALFVCALSYLITLSLYCIVRSSNLPYHINDIVGPSYLPPFTEDYFLGTDEIGRDIHSRMIVAGKNACLFASIAVTTAVTVGVSIRIICGFFGGWIDAIFSKIIEFFIVIPALLLALVSITLFGTNMYVIAITIGMVSWTSEARIIRGQIMQMRQLDYIKLSLVAKTPLWEIIVFGVVPNALPPIVVSASITMGASLLLEATLSYLGLTDLENVSCGLIAGEGQSSILFAPWVSMIPIFAIFSVVLAITLLSDGLNQLLDPKRQHGIHP